MGENLEMKANESQILFSDIMVKLHKNKACFDKLSVQIARFIPHEMKDRIIKTVKDMVITEKNGMFIVDTLFKKLLVNYIIVKSLTNIDFEDEENENMYPIYDFLVSSGLLDHIIANIYLGDINDIKECIDEELKLEVDYLNSFNNSILKKFFEITIPNFFNKITEKIPDSKELKKLTKELPNMVNKINPEKLTMVQGLVNAIEGKR